ncbi:MAG: ArgE/DapE family deacylase [Candidatus Bathyarchaeia archaeon]
MMEKKIHSTLKRVEELKLDLISLTSELIKFKTVSPPSNTLECAEFIRSHLEESGLSAKIYSREKEKANIHVRVQGGEGTIIWLGHIDVVPEGRREEWIHDPFGGVVAGDRIYGRGASDMKGSCAAAIVAARVLNEVDSKDRATVDFWFTCDEEVGSLNGTKWLLENRLLRGDACLIGDSLSRDPAKSPYIDVGCRGYLRLRLRATGRTAHASMPFYGDNAIDKLISAVEVVRRAGDYKLRIPEDIEGAIESSIEYLLSKEGLDGGQEKAIRRVYHYPTISLTMMSGGVKINVVPDYAEASFDIRVSPGSSPGELAEHIKRLIDDSGISGVNVDIIGLEEGYYEGYNSEFVMSLRDAIRVATGIEPRLKILLGATDALPVKRALGIPCLGFGAGIEELAHAPNEYVTLDGLLAAAKVYSILPLMFRKP